MELPLLYPKPVLAEVQVKILTTEIIQILSNPQHIADGTVIYKILSKLTGVSEDQLPQMALTDAMRVLFASWCLTHSRDKWTDRSVNCSCGAMAINAIKHNIDVSQWKAFDVYLKKHEIESVNQDGQPHKYTVELQPLTVEFMRKSLLAIQGEGSVAQLMCESHIKSVDGQSVNFLPLPVWSQIRKLVQPDVEQFHSLTEQTINCRQCGSELHSSISFVNTPFLECE